MKIHRPLLVGLLSLLVVGAGILVGGDYPAVAVVSIASSTTTTVPYSGTVHGQPENVFLSGLVEIGAVVVRDPDFGKPPVVVLSIDFSNVVGQGQKTGTAYVASGNQVLLRPLVKTDKVEVIFPFFPSGAQGLLSARTALASFTLTYDTAAARPTAANASMTVDPDTSLDPALTTLNPAF
jgi:hypothetical protein